MSSLAFFQIVLVAWLVLAAITFPVLLFVSAPYGRFTRQGWGPTMNRTAGWIVMESPSVLLMAGLYAASGRCADPLAIVFVLLWQVHYVNRTFIFPFRLRGDRRHMTVVTVALGVVFNLGNAYLNGYYLFWLGPPYPISWLWDPRFVIGCALFLVGLGVNMASDRTLRSLRKPGESGYAIPHGGLFRWVSAANYLGELTEWAGWAVATWSPAGLVFFVWTAANLVPRALSHHRWYRATFPDYPADRKAIIPYVL